MSKTVSVCAALWTCVVDLSDKITLKRDVGFKSWNALWEPEGQFEQSWKFVINPIKSMCEGIKQDYG